MTKVTEGVPVTVAEVGARIPGYAKHTINSWLSYQLPVNALKGVGVSLGSTYLIDRSSVGDLYWGDSSFKKMNDYFKLDAGIFWENDQLKITVNVFNVLDEYLYSGAYYKYSSAYYYQTEAPRNFRLSVNYKF